MNVRIKRYDKPKYDNGAVVVEELFYTDVLNFIVVSGGAGARHIEEIGDGLFMDPYHEYLEIKFEDGSKATFRNSYVDMFNA